MRPSGVSTSIIGSSQNRPREPVRTMVGVLGQRGGDFVCADRQRRGIARDENPGHARVSSMRSIRAGLSRPTGLPSSSADGPVAQRPRQKPAPA